MALLVKQLLLLLLQGMAMLSFLGQSLALSAEDNVHLTKVTRCPAQLVSPVHHYHSAGSRSALECVALCGRDPDCLSLLFEVDSRLCHLTNSTPTPDCVNTVPLEDCASCRAYEKVPTLVCENGGIPKATWKTCKCPYGYYGDTCNITAMDCEDCVDKGLIAKSELKVFHILPPGVEFPIPVLCQRMANGIVRTTINDRKDTTANFNLSWQAYKQGFGVPLTDTYWVGLDTLHILTNNRPYQLRIRVKHINSVIYFGFFNEFVLGNEASQYVLSINPVVPNKNLGDCLSGLIGATFSTYDVDNDGSAALHCANQHGGGWWFMGDGCSPCNPFGPILSPYDGLRKGVDGEAFWDPKLGNTIPFELMMTLVEQP